VDTKHERHAFLRALVQDQSVRSQKALLEALEAAGLGVDQSTLSRDLRELGIRKVSGSYRPAAVAGPGTTSLVPQVVRYTACGPNLIVIRTVVGQAQAVGVFLDSAGEPAIAGTLAGDDTVFVATKGWRQQTVALRRLADWFGEEHHAR
jgi:transcriptional regulator of arginine metabolism